MKKLVEEVEDLVKIRQTEISKLNKKGGNRQDEIANGVLVHCWRGGMRSAGVAWLLDLYGFKVYTLVGGYKAYRKWVRDQFEKPYQLKIVGGYTGTGKTLVLHDLKKSGLPVIDLEGIGNHKGSAFGALGEAPQPSQEMFENLLAQSLHTTANIENDIFIEDESQRIGQLQIPMPFWNTMRESKVIFLDIPFEKRLEYLTEEYGKFEKEKLVNAIIRIQKRLGGLETKNAIGFLLENNHKEAFRILLSYYDKWYTKGLNNRENLTSLLNKIPCESVDAKANANILLHETNISL
jgi:tRNA 2-selenouridine synthase